MDASPRKDMLYANGSVQEDFRFNRQVAEVFDDMLVRSIPFYQQVIDLSAALLARFLPSGATVYDLGCSTGSTLIGLARRLSGKEIRFIGIDNASAMLEKARRKAASYSTAGQIRFVQDDIMTAPLPEADAIICNYTLQFLRPMLRSVCIARLHEALRPGGILIVSEKTISHHGRFNREMIHLYHEFKRVQGYSELEIASKREALENVLIPFSLQENIDLLLQAGFAHAEPFFQWCNFASFCAIKQSDARE